ncbi:aminoacyl-tRNA hydrolase [Pectinatus haikarae]|uniref:Peptidyl-tRNA hydrolase n=1 Tax=Pectinatus haikarae TaxID=349096 RepID=A0ABT9Y928_9FIRM|nr:aminoacyl-tRNA hydrolase [Pectinatus haikarae]MDQ0204336.1 PTH1 family peptidyl-tRNA hydrolase [Pectinatus haikarae]
MKIIAGLGNPGKEYEKTKHNVGFMFIDALAKKLSAGVWQERFNGSLATAMIGAEKVLLLKPMTYMNLSGNAIAPALNWYKISPADLIVVHDDMDLPAGMIRIRVKGSSGGHNGIKSIISCIKSSEFIHVRIGIGRPLPNWKVNDHVLSKFSDEDQNAVEKAFDTLIPAVECIITESVDKAMNKYNPRKEKKKTVRNALSEAKCDE